ncbi:hypothetical protein C8J57DRAFT_1522674 [Mycena rebaudengoi]|nr:hypothetical protein C8J57DRAFT_1522674 [Mycena rebaudengoi]
MELCDTNMPLEAYIECASLKCSLVLNSSRSWHHVLKDKFLHGKRNRRLDHLLNTLVNEVLPYYALKQRRQDLGLEGPDVEIRKCQDILKKSTTYTMDDIDVLGDSLYRVRLESDPSRSYEVDMDAYTCECLDYPIISFCKHIAAVQRLFNEDQTGVPIGTPKIPAQQQPPSLPTLPSAPPKSKMNTIVAEKLERAAARLRRPGKTPIVDEALAALGSAVNAILLNNNSSVLPAARRLPPVVNDPSAWQSMMPNVKTRRVKAGDKAYGAGVTSGSKAKDKPTGRKTHKPEAPSQQQQILTSMPVAMEHRHQPAYPATTPLPIMQYHYPPHFTYYIPHFHNPSASHPYPPPSTQARSSSSSDNWNVS